MDGDLGFWTLKPDQMQVVNPLLILIFIPLYEVIFYPLLNLVGIRRPLQKLTLGGIFAGVSFVISAVVEINLEKTYAVIPGAGQAQLRIFNGRNCDYTFTSNIPDHATLTLNAMEDFEEKYISIADSATIFSLTIQSATPESCTQDVGYTRIIILEEGTARGLFLTGSTESVVTASDYEERVEKSIRGWPYMRVLANIDSTDEMITLVDNGGTERFYANSTSHAKHEDVPTDEYEVFIGTRSILTNLELKLGGVYTLIITQTATNTYTTELKTVTEPNSMSMLWLIPQYVVMTLGEVSG